MAFSSPKEPSFLISGLQIAMILTFEIFGHARNHGKKFLRLCLTSFSGIVHYRMDSVISQLHGQTELPDYFSTLLQIKVS